MPTFCGLRDFDECSCDCHKTGAVHVRNCCLQCPYCLKNIMIFHFEDHKKDCGVKHGYIAENDPFYLRKKHFMAGKDDE